LIATAVLMPPVGAVSGVTLYCIHERWWVAFAGAVLAVAAWCGFAMWYTRYTTPKRANPTVYNQLTQRLAELTLQYRQIVPPADGEQRAILYADIGRRLAMIDASLRCERGDLRWVSATGYINLWKILHRLDEELLRFDTPEQASDDARYDHDRLTGSTVPDGQAMLGDLEAAEKAIKASPAAVTAEALDTLVTIRQKINEFRDTGREGLLEARNRLVLVGIITGLALDALVGLVVAYGVSPRRLATAAAFFLAGGLIGIFKRLYDEFQTDSDVEDYSLSTARAIVVPVLSGIAGLFGVLFILVPGALNGSLPFVPTAPATTPGLATATSTAASATVVTATAATVSTATPAANLPTRTASLSDIFNIEQYPLELIVAAIFGFAPSLFVNKLQEQVNGYKTGLKSSQLSSRPQVVKSRSGTSTTASG
jgi:hypothetical protein